MPSRVSPNDKSSRDHAAPDGDPALINSENANWVFPVQVPPVDNVSEPGSDDPTKYYPDSSTVDVFRVKSTPSREEGCSRCAGVHPGHDHQAVPTKGEGPQMDKDRVDIDFD